MQIFPCPFCGPRDETEFRFLGEADKLRPAGGAAARPPSGRAISISSATAKGRVAEIWSHVPCGEMFRMERDNVTHVVYASASLRKESER